MKKEQPIPLVDVIDPSPKLGDKKKITKFAFFPVKIVTKYDTISYIWLRKYKEVYEYQKIIKPIPSNYPFKNAYMTKMFEYNDWKLIRKKV